MEPVKFGGEGEIKLIYETLHSNFKCFLEKLNVSSYLGDGSHSLENFK